MNQVEFGHADVATRLDTLHCFDHPAFLECRRPAGAGLSDKIFALLPEIP